MSKIYVTVISHDFICDVFIDFIFYMYEDENKAYREDNTKKTRRNCKDNNISLYFN